MEGTEKSESSYYLGTGIDSKVTHHIMAMEKVAAQNILTKCSTCNTFQVISDLVNDFMNLLHEIMWFKNS